MNNKAEVLKEKHIAAFSELSIPDISNAQSILENLTDDKVNQLSDLRNEMIVLRHEGVEFDDEFEEYSSMTYIILNAWDYATAVTMNCMSREIISPEEFVKKWTEAEPIDSLFKYELTEELKICNKATQTFLLDAGFPNEAAPFLGFPGSREPARIYESWASPDDWDDEDREVLKRYYSFGSDGSGNPICIDNNNNDVIVLLDHEAAFTPLAFVNSSIAQFAECLLVYRNFIKETQDENGDNAFLDRNMSKESIENLRKEINEIDCRALLDKCFWYFELNSLESE